MTSPPKWPTDKPAQLYMPLQWKQTTDDAACTIEYDSTRQLIKIVDEEHSIIDIINPMDIIGVDVEIKLFDSRGEVGFRNVPSFTNSPVEGAPTNDCNIFDPVLQDQHHIFSCNKDNDMIAVDSQAAAILNIYSYPKSSTSKSWLGWLYSSSSRKPNPNFHQQQGSNTTGPRQASHYSFPVAPAHDFEALTELVKAIRRVSLLSSEQQQRRKYLIIVNPKSGTGLAPQIWKRTVQPMLEKEAGIDIILKETNYTGHALEMMRDEFDDLLDYDAVVCLGGDGVLHEILQGWQARPDFEQILKKVRLGVLGCGTGNGLAKSLTHAAEVWHLSSVRFCLCVPFELRFCSFKISFSLSLFTIRKITVLLNPLF